MSEEPRERLITLHQRPEWDAARLLDMIRSKHIRLLCLRMIVPVLLLLSAACFLQRGMICVLLLSIAAGYCLGCGSRLLYDFRMIRTPQKSRVFRKYGTPERVAEILLSTGGKLRMFDNGRLLLNAELLVDREDPETLLYFSDARLAYSQRQVLLGAGTRETLTVYDRWGEHFRYRVSGKGQFFRAEVLLDRLAQNLKCRIGNTPANHAYVKQETEPLGAVPVQEEQ